MFCALGLPLLLLQFSTRVFANPVAASSQNAAPDGALFAGSSIALNPSRYVQNASTVICHPIENSLLTLFLQTSPSSQILRTDLVTALYHSRDYIRSRISAYGNDTALMDVDDPFDSYKHAAVNCSLVVASAPKQTLAYGDLGSVVQGLMDVMFYPFRAKVEGGTFAVYHAVRGFVAVGSLGV